MTQIYMPCQDFSMIAKCLDSKRLCKQLTEAKQVYTANKYGYGKQGNPKPYEMWKGFDNALSLYIIELYKEWQIRLVLGLRGGVLIHSAGEFVLNDVDLTDIEIEYPDWFNDERVFSSYRSCLLYKNYEHYSRFGWSEIPATPIKIDKKGNITLPYHYGI